MNEEIRLANKIRQALNEGARLDKPGDARVAERLRAARERALAAHRISPAGEHEPALAATRSSSLGLVSGFGGIGGFSLRVVLPALLTIAGLVAIFSWQQDRRAADIEELDAQLLTDDLPLDAYLDKGFEAWLKKVSADDR